MYGGTKTEMERLLKDAQKLTGVKYDISNLDDVFHAINAIQGELGITGTTALEAEETIQGSILAMKSAFSNFVTGLGYDNADLELLVGELVDSAMTAVDNLMPVIETVLNSLVEMMPIFAEKIQEILPLVIDFITENLPLFIESGMSILTSLIEGLVEALPILLESVLDIIMQLIDLIVDTLPDIIDMGIELILALADGLVEATPNLIPVIIDAIVLIVKKIVDSLPQLISAGIDVIFALIDGLVEATPDLIDEIPDIIIKIVTAIIENLPKLFESGKKLLTNILEGIIQTIPKIPSYIIKVVSGIVNYIKKTNWFQTGKDILNGISSGIIGSVGAWAKRVGSSIMNGIKGFFGIKSPSTRFRDEVGINLAEGLGVGFEDEMGKISDSMYDAVPTDFSVDGTVSTSFKNANGMDKFDEMIYLMKELLGKDTSLYLDGDKLVGGTVKKYDKAMGNLVAIRGR